jgi:hypothetical protein
MIIELRPLKLSSRRLVMGLSEDIALEVLHAEVDDGFAGEAEQPARNAAAPNFTTLGKQAFDHSIRVTAAAMHGREPAVTSA